MKYVNWKIKPSSCKLCTMNRRNFLAKYLEVSSWYIYKFPIKSIIGANIFFQIPPGAYGSEEENRLESILDQTEEMRNRIVEANFKWRQAQMMVDYAHKQLEYAVQKWKDIEEINQRYINIFGIQMRKKIIMFIH